MTNIDLLQKSSARPKNPFQWIERLVLIAKGDPPEKLPNPIGDDGREVVLATNRASAFSLVERFTR